ncbi:hypothetical protein QR680_005448 [Steinernema hermaphroditum]|uniref:C-1-tetrahydrofolate synthase, cytoplasmic n=1 Tax=Steinernema hermaphroditum TaxID=289476 RepID=A0AA39HUA9_9BILA|nr:hypothetical protein QR680_005448 [Steinernema hermaphroditum]
MISPSTSRSTFGLGLRLHVCGRATFRARRLPVDGVSLSFAREHSVEARTICGRRISEHILDSVRHGFREAFDKRPNFSANLTILQVGNGSASDVYSRSKCRAAAKVGVRAKLVKLGTEATQQEIEAELQRLNDDSDVDGIILQLPLDCVNPVDVNAVTNRIDPEKDVDGLTRKSVGRLMRGELDPSLVPGTASACVELAKSVCGKEGLQGKHVVVVGRSRIVGSPTAALFLWHDATTTICHLKTQNLKDLCRLADVLVVGVGRPNFVRGKWVKPGAIVIDCGVNVEATERRRGKLVGDVHFEEAKHVAGHITPVPGGVGPVTVAVLIRNTFLRALLRRPKW